MFLNPVTLILALLPLAAVVWFLVLLTILVRELIGFRKDYRRAHHIEPN